MHIVRKRGESGEKMKDMTFEEVLALLEERIQCNDIVQAKKLEAELLRRFEVIEKELKATKLAHAVEKQIMQDNFDKCKTAAEYLKTENNNLRCCGNCKLHDEPECPHWKVDPDCGAYYPDPNYCCSSWTTDGLSLEEREGK